MDQHFDSVNAKVDGIKAELNEYLAKVREMLGGSDKVQFVHGRLRYEIEVPVEVVSDSKPKELELTSKRTGYERFHTEELEEKVEQLEGAEQELKEAITPFVYALFAKFAESRQLWQQTVQVLAELDCLVSLGVVSREPGMCRP